MLKRFFGEASYMDMGNIGLKDAFIEKHTHTHIYRYSVIVFGSWKMHGSLWYLKKTPLCENWKFVSSEF